MPNTPKRPTSADTPASFDFKSAQASFNRALKEDPGANPGSIKLKQGATKALEKTKYTWLGWLVLGLSTLFAMVGMWFSFKSKGGVVVDFACTGLTDAKVAWYLSASLFTVIAVATSVGQTLHYMHIPVSHRRYHKRELMRVWAYSAFALGLAFAGCASLIIGCGN